MMRVPSWRRVVSRRRGILWSFKIKLRQGPEQGNLPANAPADIPFEIRPLGRGVWKQDGRHKDLALKGNQLGSASLPRAVPGTDFAFTNPVIIEAGASEATFSVTVVDDGGPGAA